MPNLTSEYIDYDKSILLRDVVVMPIPLTIEVQGHTLHRKNEFHITLTNPYKLAAYIDEQHAPEIAKDLITLFKEYVAAHPIAQYELYNTFYFVQKDSRKTVVALAKVPALRGFFVRVRQKYGVDVPEQPAHVTLYTLWPDKVGIGIRSRQELSEIAKRIPLDLRIAPQVLIRTKFGNPILREKTTQLTKAEIASKKIQHLIADMQYSLVSKAFGKYGVGLAAPQVGKNVAISVISVKPTPRRPQIKKRIDMVIINPEITEVFGHRSGMWEGCISCGKGNETLYAKALRYKKTKLRWTDQTGQDHHHLFEGFLAHIIQHETDHLNGILFVDRVRDTKTYMTADEYRKRAVESSSQPAPKRKAI